MNSRHSVQPIQMSVCFSTGTVSHSRPGADMAENAKGVTIGASGWLDADKVGLQVALGVVGSLKI